jgi:hypothetical protein
LQHNSIVKAVAAKETAALANIISGSGSSSSKQQQAASSWRHFHDLKFEKVTDRRQITQYCISVEYFKKMQNRLEEGNW